MTFDLPRPTGRVIVPPSASWAGGAWRGLIWLLRGGNEARKAEPTPVKLGRETNDSIIKNWWFETLSRGGQDLNEGPVGFELQYVEQNGGLEQMVVADWWRDP